MRVRTAVVTGVGSLVLVVAGFVGLSNPAQAESHSVIVSCVGGVPTYSSNNLAVASGDTITLLNSTGGKLNVVHESAIIGDFGPGWPNATSRIFTMGSSSFGQLQVSGGGSSPCGGMGTLLAFHAVIPGVCEPGACDYWKNRGAGGTSSGAGILGSLEGLALKAEHFSELAMKDDVALLAATTKEDAIAAAKRAIIHEKAALRASEKVLQGLIHPTRTFR